MKVLILLISLSWCLGVCLQQILWDTLWISWFVQYQLFQISPTTRSLTWSAIWLSWSQSKSSSISTISTSITHMMKQLLRYVTAWARWSTRPPLPTSPLRASFTTRCQLELEHKFRMGDWKQEDGTVKLVLILHAVWIDDLATIWIGLTMWSLVQVWHSCWLLSFLIRENAPVIAQLWKVSFPQIKKAGFKFFLQSRHILVFSFLVNLSPMWFKFQNKHFSVCPAPATFQLGASTFPPSAPSN